jgi:hypothetical protein
MQNLQITLGDYEGGWIDQGVGVGGTAIGICGEGSTFKSGVGIGINGGLDTGHSSSFMEVSQLDSNIFPPAYYGIPYFCDSFDHGFCTFLQGVWWCGRRAGCGGGIPCVSRRGSGADHHSGWGRRCCCLFYHRGRWGGGGGLRDI